MTVANDTRAQYLELYDREADRLFRHIWLRVADRERAMDITQEAFCRTWSELAKGKVIENLRAFLYRVARNVMIDMGRKRTETPLTDLEEIDLIEDVEQEGVIIRDAEYAEAIAAAQELPKEFREVLLLRYVDDLAPKEIATILGISANLVSVRIDRGIKALRERFGVSETL